jgi:hypothetical protein
MRLAADFFEIDLVPSNLYNSPNMKAIRRQGFLLLLIFAVLTLGIHFHSHAQGQDQSNTSCKLCHLSHASLEVADSAFDCLGKAYSRFDAPLLSPLFARPLAIRLPGRAPPQA